MVPGVHSWSEETHGLEYAEDLYQLLRNEGAPLEYLKNLRNAHPELIRHVEEVDHDVHYAYLDRSISLRKRLPSTPKGCEGVELSEFSQISSKSDQETEDVAL